MTRGAGIVRKVQAVSYAIPVSLALAWTYSADVETGQQDAELVNDNISHLEHTDVVPIVSAESIKAKYAILSM